MQRQDNSVGGEGENGYAMSEHQRAMQQFQLFEESLPKVSQTVHQMLLNEIVPMAISMQRKLRQDQTDTTVEDSLYKLKISIPLEEQSHRLVQSMAQLNGEDRELVMARIRDIGYRMGSKMSELLIFSNNPNLQLKEMDLLSVMKFICRDVWKQLYGKQVDNLKTNHRGTFYLFDYEYKPIQSFYLDGDPPKRLETQLKIVEPFIQIPVGLIKGVLASLKFADEDITCTASFVDRPQGRPKASFPKGISFQVQVQQGQ